MTPAKELDAETSALPKLPGFLSLGRALITRLAEFYAELDTLREQVRADASRPPRVRRLIGSDEK